MKIEYVGMVGGHVLLTTCIRTLIKPAIVVHTGCKGNTSNAKISPRRIMGNKTFMNAVLCKL